MHLKLFFSVSIFCLAAIFTYGQNETPDKCAAKILEQTDSVSGNFTRSFKEKFVVAVAPKERLEFDLKQFNEAIVVSVLMKGAGDYCLDETSKMIVKFVSGQTVTLPMDGKFNCDNEFASFFGGPFAKKKEFRMLLDNEIETLRVEARKSVIDKTRKNFMEVKFTEAQRKEFMERLDCLVD
jgi:hypothetical protein